MKAVLLAAGLGTRLLPITKKISKPMIPIAGKPFLEYIINDLVSCDIDQVCIVIGHLSNQIKDYFHDGSKFNIDIQYVIQKNYKGTADAILHSKDFVGNDPFLLYLADTIIPEDLKIHVKNMKISNSDVEILTSKVPTSLLNAVGTVRLMENNFVSRIDEKSKVPNSDLGWAGLAFFNDNSILNEIKNIDFSNSKEVSIVDSINKLIISGKQVRNRICSKFIDSGTPKGLIECANYILNKRSSHSNFSRFKNSKILESVYIGKNCLIGNNSTIGPNTSIENNVKIHENVIINNSIILDDVEINSNQHITNSIVTKYGNISIN